MITRESEMNSKARERQDSTFQRYSKEKKQDIQHSSLLIGIDSKRFSPVSITPITSQAEQARFIHEHQSTDHVLTKS